MCLQDQRLALPSDSYLVNYFDNLDAYLDVGPPVYFVSKDVDVTQRLGQQALCGRFSTCDDFSIANRLEAERKRANSSFIAEPSASWVDDFLRWLNPQNFQCCRVRKADPSVFCGPRDRDRLCQPCYQDKQPPWNITMDGLPEDAEFMRYFKQWWDSPTDESCPLAGKTSWFVFRRTGVRLESGSVAGRRLSISRLQMGAMRGGLRDCQSPMMGSMLLRRFWRLGDRNLIWDFLCWFAL